MMNQGHTAKEVVEFIESMTIILVLIALIIFTVLTATGCGTVLKHEITQEDEIQIETVKVEPVYIIVTGNIEPKDFIISGNEIIFL